MKTYSIGRDLNCDIVINDVTDVISRRHALLNVLPSGKMTIVDQSSNGTYVNGIRISPNVPVPVTRKDTISFAHIAKLDWNIIPKSNRVTMYVLIGVGALVLIALIVLGALWLKNRDTEDAPGAVCIERTDSVGNTQAADDDSELLLPKKEAKERARRNSDKKDKADKKDKTDKKDKSDNKAESDVNSDEDGERADTKSGVTLPDSKPAKEQQEKTSTKPARTLG